MILYGSKFKIIKLTQWENVISTFTTYNNQNSPNREQKAETLQKFPRQSVVAPDLQLDELHTLSGAVLDVYFLAHDLDGTPSSVLT